MGSVALALLLGTESAGAVKIAKFNQWNPDLSMSMVEKPHHRHSKHAKKHKKSKPSIPACTSFECKTDTVDPYTKKRDLPYPHDYKVPDHGLDKDVIDTQNHIKSAEGKLGSWNLPAKALHQSDPICASADCPDVHLSAGRPKDEKHPINYPVADHGPDHDIEITKANIKAAEEKLGTWNLPKKDAALIQSDPICATADCPEVYRSAADQKPKHPVDYAVADHGPDTDIATSQANLEKAQAEHGHIWELKNPEKPFEDLPTETAEFKLAGTATEVHVESDPVFNSNGMEMRHYKGEGPAHLVNMPYDHSSDDDKSVKYDFHPELDSDIKHTHEHVAGAEAALNHSYMNDSLVQSEVDALEKEFDEIKKAAAEDDHAEKVKQLAAESLHKQPQQSMVQTGVMTAQKANQRFNDVRKLMMSNWGTK